MENDYQERVELAKTYYAKFSKKYKVEICSYDKTALLVYCTDEEHSSICKQLQCSGIYVVQKKAGIITNFGYYKPN